jgi:hypothetical protein
VLGLPDNSTYGLFEALKNCSITHFLHSDGRISLSSFNPGTLPADPRAKVSSYFALASS